MANNQVPMVADFSKKAIQREVIRKGVLENPWTLLPLAGGAAAVFAGVLLGIPAIGLAGGAGLVWGFGGNIVNVFFRHNTLAQSYLRRIREEQEAYLAALPGRLQKSLAEEGCERGLRQLAELERSFKDLREILETRFSTEGLTLGRFLGTAEQARRGALERLGLIADQLKAIGSIPDDLEDELKKLDERSESAQHIRERLGHRDQGKKVIGELHDDVEASLTRISEISTSIARIGMEADAESQFENCLAELQELASSASSFNREK